MFTIHPQPRRLLFLAGVLIGAMSSSSAWARAAIHGEVQDRNGQPMARVNVRVLPGNVEIVTDDEGKFTIDYLRDDAGDRVRLSNRTTYTFEIYKLGFQLARLDLEYTHGEVALDPVTLTPDTITVRASSTDMDSANAPASDAQGGGSYEGE